MGWMLLAIFAGVCNGTFALPMKFATRWKWENIWGAFILWGFLIFPILLGVFTIPRLGQIFVEVGLPDLFYVFIFGFLWGIGSICFGLGIRYIGIGLAFSINIGITIAVGSMFPLFHGEMISSASSESIRSVIVGVIVIIVGVAVNGYAGALREKASRLPSVPSAPLSKFPAKRTALIGIVLCLFAGLFSPMLQVSFIYGGKILQVAAKMGVDGTLASNAIWIIALAGGFVVNFVYIIWLFNRNKSFKLFETAGARGHHMLAFMMGFLWVVTIACYGMAASNMGDLGLSVGWAIFNSVGIATANLLGLLTNEWRSVDRKTIIILFLGLFILVLGTCIVSMAEFPRND